MEDNSLEKLFEDTIKYIKENLNLLEKNKNFVGKLKDREIKEFELLEKDFKNKYERFKDIKRFSIPIIGLISCGKSSFLNFLLGMNCLESGDDIITKCVVIIRHNKELEPNEIYIYSVKFIERSKGYYDFEKDEETKSKDIIKKIKERNDLIKNSGENTIPKNEEFFLILEASIPLFRRKNAKYGDFFEFLDLPGLDEGKDDSKSYKSSNFFKKNFLPKIAYNSLFSILIFDAGKYMRDENPIIFKDYIEKYFHNNYRNSFFILNKIDLMDNEEKEKNDFEEYMLKNQLKVDLKDPTIHINYLSCKNLTKETKKFENFQSYLKYLLTEGGNGKTNLLLYLKEKMVEDFNLDLTRIGNEKPNKEQINDIIKKIKELKNEKTKFKDLLDFKDYFNYSIVFEELNIKLKQNEDKNEEHKSKKYQELYEDFNKSFENSFKSFLNIPNDKEMTNRIKNIINNVDKISNENKDKIIQTQNYLDLLYKNLNDNIKLAIDKFYKLKTIVNELYKEGKSLKTFQNLKNEFRLIEFFIKKDKN